MGKKLHIIFLRFYNKIQNNKTRELFCFLMHHADGEFWINKWMAEPCSHFTVVGKDGHSNESLVFHNVYLNSKLKGKKQESSLKKNI